MARSLLTGKLEKELTSNRRKVFILAILVVVGMSIWIPQISRILRSREVQPISSLSHPAQVPTAESAGSGSHPMEKPSSWREISKWIEKQELVHPIGSPLHLTSPFGMKEVPEEQKVAIHEVLESRESGNESSEPSDVVSSSLLPAPASLILKSTMQGSTLRGAVINDRYYRVGDRLECANEHYLVSQIEARRVILLRGEQRYELSIPSVLPRSEEAQLPLPVTEPSARNL